MKRAEEDGRAKLVSVFISNLSCRIPRSALWEAFNSYGKVMDVFIKFTSFKPFTFGFVRYQSVEECERAISEANLRWMDWRVIGVKKADVGWSDRKIRSSWSRSLFKNSEVQLRLKRY